MTDATKKLKVVIGRAERVDFPTAGVVGVPAKIDTGAYRSSVWATDVRVEHGVLKFKLLSPESEYYSGDVCEVEKFEIVEVENSFGHSEERYSVFLPIRLGGRRVNTNITLSDRSNKTYPVLVGRRMLRGKYVVDVSRGSPIPDEEKR